MAPSRRRGAGKAAAAVAACRQWKVGDLVLAKVKGFPAWPATVSEPEKWGCKKAEKKVFVFFFGTQQIAFCNPGDVEAFTEEKKHTLLTKRQGKGADFVRAVREIIESYEKLKQQDENNACTSAADDDTLVNGENSMESSAHIELKDSGETFRASIIGRNGSGFPSANCQDGEENGSLHVKEVILEQPTVEMMVTETATLAAYISRERSGGLQSSTFVTQKRSPSVEESRSLSQEESCRLQGSLMPSFDGSKSAGSISTNRMHEGSVRKNKRIRNSPSTSQCNVVESSAFTSNGSIEDNGSEVVTVNSDSFGVNDGSTTDSGSQVEHSATVADTLEGDAEFGKGLHFQDKAIVRKKKRKANRKRVTNDMVEPIARLETETSMDVRVPNHGHKLENACENSSGRCNKEDGDEHLPLVKRARVRMGKLSSWEEENNSSIQSDTKVYNVVVVSPVEAEGRISSVVEVSELEHGSPPTHCGDDFSGDRDSLTTREALKNSSSPTSSFQIQGNGPELLRAKENQSFVSIDVEAALPPSKRLHRALEAMCANAAEQDQACANAAEQDQACANTAEQGQACANTAEQGQACANAAENGQPCADTPEQGHVYADTAEQGHSCADADEQGQACANAAETLIRDSLRDATSTFIMTSHLAIENNEEDNLMDQTLKPLYSNTTEEHATLLLLDADICNQPIDTQNCKEPQKFSETMDLGDDKVPGGTCSGTLAVCTPVQACSPPNLDRRHASSPSNQQTVDQLSSPKIKSEEIKFQDYAAEHFDRELDCLNHSAISQNFSSHADEASKITYSSFKNVASYSAENDDYKNTNSSRSQIGDDSRAIGMSEVADDIKFDQRQIEASIVSTSYGHLVDKDVHSPSVVDTPAQLSPPTASICHVSTSESANMTHSSGCCSPTDHLYQKRTSYNPVCGETKEEPQKAKAIGKCSNHGEAHAAVSSFEGIFASLTRTKESIGRATRIAIDCAKFGVSAKVVEILARNLESESSLHRRVDLFFLVDSIMQFSRGLKGDLGGVYPSAIQAVLPRLLSAAAPPGSFAQENRRQCMKVLRVWLERKILSESVVRHHLRELDRLGGSSSAGAYSRRSARNERAFDDPVRDMEGMLVDEYGSNSSFQLPGLCMPRMLKDEDNQSDSDGEGFEAVTPEHTNQVAEAQEVGHLTKKHRHLLEDVDGELEMEDVAPSCEVEVGAAGSTSAVNAPQALNEQFQGQASLPFVPPLPLDVPPSSPPLPATPPPPPPPLPPPVPAISSSSVIPDLVYAADSETTKHVQDDFGRSDVHQSVAPRINPSISNGKPYHAPESSERINIHPSHSTSSFSSYPTAPVNSVQYNDGPSFHHRAYPPRPHAPPPDQFSYVQAGHHLNSRRESPPPSYSRRYNSWKNSDDGNFYDNHDRMRRDPYEQNENWRFGPPNFPGPRYPGRYEDTYEPVPYRGPPREPNRVQHQGWGYHHHHHREMHHRNFVPYRQPSEAPGIWRPR